MKKALMIVFFLFLLSPLWAIYCQNCGTAIANDSKFCSQCGKPLTADTSTNQPLPVAENNSDVSSFNYDSVNNFESTLASSNHSASIRNTSGSWYEARENLKKAGNSHNSFNPVMKKLHNLYQKKYDLLEGYHAIWVESERNPSRTDLLSRKEKIRHQISQTNEIIRVLNENRNDPGILSRIEDMEKGAEKTNVEYIVTSPYLQLDAHRIPKNQPLWVMELKNGSAKVMHMGNIGFGSPVTAWISIYDLEKRTSWRADVYQTSYAPYFMPTTVIIEKEPPPSTVVVYEDCWGRHRYPSHFDMHFDWGFGNRSHRSPRSHKGNSSGHKGGSSNHKRH
ncbi:MAG: zinc ribbon domain-containing protein [Candidatus Riflebacteria bacterium]|nr:zinc ribbon domain-containing protein [Candidatus Riflebacteria bacterium]